MSYDPELVERLHALLAGEQGVEERRMFGGVGFMVGGSLTVAAMGGGGLLARVGRDAAPGLIGPGVEQMVMQDRVMSGWLRVAPEVCDGDDELALWVRRCVEFVRTLD